MQMRQITLSMLLGAMVTATITFLALLLGMAITQGGRLHHF